MHKVRPPSKPPAADGKIIGIRGRKNLRESNNANENNQTPEKPIQEIIDQIINDDPNQENPEQVIKKESETNNVFEEEEEKHQQPKSELEFEEDTPDEKSDEKENSQSSSSKIQINNVRPLIIPESVSTSLQQTDTIQPNESAEIQTPDEFCVYACINITKKFKPLEFHFLKNSSIIYHVIADRLINPSKFDVINQETQEIEAVIQISKKRTVFELMMNSDQRECQCITKIDYNGYDKDIRHIEFASYDEEMKEKCHLFEKPPTKNRDGKLTLYFGGKIVIPSIMNCILRTAANNDEVVGVRLIKDNTLEIDTKIDIKPSHVLTLAVASYHAR
ncbi:hypothetical protein TRFO_28522 [Tritrichomonas foetus]|uniref:Tubby C-terminal domain-containing protein n=1 Tax=Tritrichomonas foetus TaxID=1144522 RepID=A0A1J4JXZ3_9EUKA|nr:hypothetical protein TRFO_28522 [Tritrichomonas foetus]|eukprot:OHT04031.1 hypothetical protein TRFO_28522 [Tritrichomonas foetus]